MTPKELRRRIKRLPADTPRHKAMEAALREGVGFGAWYGSQKEHWLGWLADYTGPGAYGRRAATRTRDAAYVWTHTQCPPMLFWLVEALGFPDPELAACYDRVIAAGPNGAARCATLRKDFPWARVETLLKEKTGFWPLGFRLAAGNPR